MKNELNIKVDVENQTITVQQKDDAKAKAKSYLKKKGYNDGVVFIHADGTVTILALCPEGNPKGILKLLPKKA